MGMTSVVAMSQAFAAAKLAGVDRQQLYDIMSAGPSNSPFMKFCKNYAVDGNSDLGFSLNNANKDLGYFAQMVSDLGSRSLVAEATSTAQTIAKALVEARKRAAPVKAFPGDIPSTLKAAYAVQHAGVTLRDEKVIGFKVGGIPESWRDQYKSSWMAGPVFLSEFHKVEAGGTLDVPVFKDGFAAYEPELVMVLEGLDKLEASIDTIEEALTYVSGRKRSLKSIFRIESNSRY